MGYRRGRPRRPWSPSGGSPNCRPNCGPDPMTPPACLRLSNGPLVGVGLLAAIFVYLSFRPLWDTGRVGPRQVRGVVLDPPGDAGRRAAVAVHGQRRPRRQRRRVAEVTYYGLYEFGAAVAGGTPSHSSACGAECLGLSTCCCSSGGSRSCGCAPTVRRVVGVGQRGSCCTAAGLVDGRSPSSGRRRLRSVSSAAVVKNGLNAANLSRRAMVALPILFLLWANIHGTFAVLWPPSGCTGSADSSSAGPATRTSADCSSRASCAGLARLV